MEKVHSCSIHHKSVDTIFPLSLHVPMVWHQTRVARRALAPSVVTYSICFTFSYSMSCPSVQRTWFYYTWRVATKDSSVFKKSRRARITVSSVCVLVLLTCVLSPQEPFLCIGFLSRWCHCRLLLGTSSSHCSSRYSVGDRFIVPSLCLFVRQI